MLKFKCLFCFKTKQRQCILVSMLFHMLDGNASSNIYSHWPYNELQSEFCFPTLRLFPGKVEQANFVAAIKNIQYTISGNVDSGSEEKQRFSLEPSTWVVWIEKEISNERWWKHKTCSVWPHQRASTTTEVKLPLLSIYSLSKVCTWTSSNAYMRFGSQFK